MSNLQTYYFKLDFQKVENVNETNFMVFAAKNKK